VTSDHFFSKPEQMSLPVGCFQSEFHQKGVIDARNRLQENHRHWMLAIEAAVEKASQSLRGLSWFEVTEFRGGIRDGALEYQATIEVAFKID
jgi:flavin-binding protein dodecin